MHRFRRHIHRERRRIGIFVVLVTLAAFLIFSDDLGLELGIRQWAFAALGTGIGAGLVALGMLMITPSWRHSLETVAVATLVYAVVLVQVPGLSFHDQRHSLAAFVGFLIAAALIHQLIYGRWSDRLLRLRNGVERTTCLTRLDRDQVWQAACPQIGRPEFFWDGSVVSIDAVEDDADALTLFHRFPNGMMLHQRLCLVEVRPGKALRYGYEVLGAMPRGPQSLALVLEQRGPVLAIHLRWERGDYPLRLALMHWIDDWGGRVVDGQLARLEAAEDAAETAEVPAAA